MAGGYRVRVVGPPCGGVSRQAQRLAAALGVPVMRAEDALGEALAEYERVAAEHEEAAAAAREEAEAAGEEPEPAGPPELSARAALGERARREGAGAGGVGDETLVGLVVLAVQEAEGAEAGHVLDGFPRTAAQARILEPSSEPCVHSSAGAHPRARSEE